MEVRDNISPTPLDYGTYEWDLSGEKNERSPDVEKTMATPSLNDEESVANRSMDIIGTTAKRWLTKLGSTLQRLAQTANATRQRQKQLLAAKEIPKSKVYPDVCAWLLDDRNIQEATNYVYKNIDDLTDNTPDLIVDRLNELGLVPKDKPSEKWSPQTLAPVVFHLRLNRRYKPETVILIHCCWAVAFLFACGFWGSKHWRNPELAETPQPVGNVQEYVNNWEDKHHYWFSPWRRENLIDPTTIRSSDSLDAFLTEQTKAQGKSFNKPKDRK